jgi:hypothetical protein
VPENPPESVAEERCRRGGRDVSSPSPMAGGTGWNAVGGGEEEARRRVLTRGAPRRGAVGGP